MIRLGLRLTLAAGREALIRLTVIALAVTIGTGLLLTVLAGVNAVHAQNARYGWLNTALAPPVAASADPMWWALREDYYEGHTIGRVDVAALGPRAAVPPGVPRLPGPGEYYASPALAELIRDAPAAQLADRYPGHAIGTLGAAALPSPDSLLVLVGGTPGQVSRIPFAGEVSGIVTADAWGHCADNNCYVGLPSAAMDLIFGVVGVALLFPVLILIGTATRLAATRREQRFAAMRLVGATPWQVSTLSAVESGVAALIGTGLGFALFFALRPALAGIAFTGDRFFLADLSLNAVDVLAVAVGIPLGAIVAARLALRRVRISPLGVTRQARRRPPTAWRLTLLVAGVAELCVFLWRHPQTSHGQLIAYLSGIFVIMAGLVVAGPWLAMLGSRVLARAAGSAPTLIAGRRLADNPQVAFRAVSGLMLALFVTTVATGIITTFVANRGAPDTGTVDRTALSLAIWPEEIARGTPAPQASQVPAGLATIPGVTSVNVVYANPGGAEPGAAPGFVRCAGLPPEFGSCPAGAEVAAVYPDLIGWSGDNPPGAKGPAWPAAPVTAAGLGKLPLISVVVGTDGSAAAIEQSRTLLGNAFPAGHRPPATGYDFRADGTKSFSRFQQLADVVIAVSLPIAGCSLAVAVAGGLADRKRPFSMLRLTGMRLAELRRVVLLESAVPLLVVAALAIAMGLLAAQLFLRSQLHYTLVWPGTTFVVLIVAGLIASLGVIASTMPLLRRMTGPETARNE